MKRDELRQSDNDDLQETDLEKISLEDYEQRRNIQAQLGHGDWWIAIAMYLLLASIALVAFWK